MLHWKMPLYIRVAGHHKLGQGQAFSFCMVITLKDPHILSRIYNYKLNGVATLQPGTLHCWHQDTAFSSSLPTTVFVRFYGKIMQADCFCKEWKKREFSKICCQWLCSTSADGSGKYTINMWMIVQDWQLMFFALLFSFKFQLYLY